MCVEKKKWPLGLYFFFSLYAFCFFALCRLFFFFYFVQDKIVDDPFHNRYCKRCTKRVILYFASLPFILSIRS